MAADRYADGELTIAVGGDEVAIHGAWCIINGELHALNRNVSTIIIYCTAYGERTYVLKVDTIVYQRLCADEACFLCGRELMHTLGRTDGICASIAREGDAVNGVTSTLVGNSADGKLILARHVIGDVHVDDGTMVAIGYTTLLGIVVCNSLVGNTLV